MVVRDEEWLVTRVQHTPSDGLLVHCTGTSPFVRDTEASFFTKVDNVEPLQPENTQLVADASPQFRTSRLYLEAMIRKTPVPATETGLAVSQSQLLDSLDYQRRAVHKALTSLRPRLLIADAVGLGKTLEVGMILSELIRRGRGDKILVVTPRHILEQFQHELWTRFAIPLVRLDSEGIQRVRRKIPGDRNPFTYYKRAIISIDTLKNAGRYRHHLEGVRWDAVVIDECHNLVNRGTLNNQLARTLAPRTEALLLTSATPHNGDPESFAELVRLLDPTAIADPTKIDEKAISHLYVRRHKHHDDVSAEVAANWADRHDPKPMLIDASLEEEALFAELADTWTHPTSGQAPTTGRGRSLFPWTLFKAALSSHEALAQTIDARRNSIAKAIENDEEKGKDTEKGIVGSRLAEDQALETLGKKCAAITDANSSKLQTLLAELKEIGIGPRSKTRVVIFSERIATLDWLARTVPKELGLKDKQVRVLHGGMADVKQMDVIEEFGLAESPVRVLFTGDMASEGVNLHRQCHHLIHFDLPWSLITIEQRNGRIDRYGQTERPEIRALLLKPGRADLDGDIRIITKLLDREHEAHKAFGDSGSLLGLHNVEAEEKAITEKLRDAVDPDDAIPSKPEKAFDIMALLAGGTGNEAVPTYEAPSLFNSQLGFVDEALAVAFDDPDATLDRRREADNQNFVSLQPTPDLVKRLRALPQSYLKEQGVAERFLLTGDKVAAEAKLETARNSTKSSWPTIGYLSPLHPFLDWLVDKVLMRMGRNEAPVIVCDVAEPVYCIQGLYSNGQGQPQLVEWMAITEAYGQTIIADLFDVLDKAGVAPGMANPGRDEDLRGFEKLIPAMVSKAKDELVKRRDDHDVRLDELLAEPTERLETWTQQSLQLAGSLQEKDRRSKEKHTRQVGKDTEQVIASMRTVGEPLVRVVAVLVPGASS